ncbi:hypothetical protein GCM10023159_14380 [Brevibacterium yomogidense]
MPDLAAGVREFELLTGARTVPGGSHPGRGTANHLVPLIPRGWEGAPLTYLEILGPDPAQDPALAARSLPGVTGLCAQRWAAHPTGFDAAVARADQAGVDYGDVFDMSRHTPDGGLLAWRLTRRTPLAHGGAQPFLIDWGSSPHPAHGLRPQPTSSQFTTADPAASDPAASDPAASDPAAPAPAAEAPVTLLLERLEFFGPDPERLSDAIRVLTEEQVSVEAAAESGFRATISGPRGELTLTSVGVHP